MYRNALFHKCQNVCRSAIQPAVIAGGVECGRHGNRLFCVIYKGTYCCLHGRVVQIADIAFRRVPKVRVMCCFFVFSLRMRRDLRIRCEFSDIILISASELVVEVFNVVETEKVSCRTNRVRTSSITMFQLVNATARPIDGGV